MVGGGGEAGKIDFVTRFFQDKVAFLKTSFFIFWGPPAPRGPFGKQLFECFAFFDKKLLF